MAAGAFTKKSVQLDDMDASPGIKISAEQGRRFTAVGVVELLTPGIGLQASMVRVPKGARIVGGEAWWDALGASTQITIGDSDDTDRFMTLCPTAIGKAAAGNIDAGGTGRFNRVSGNTGRSGANISDTGIGYRYTCEKDILVSFNDQDPTGTLTLTVDYILT